MRALMEVTRGFGEMNVRDEIAQRIAWVFPGQGSQYVGMGKRVFEVSEAARRVFHQADEVLGYSISSLCFHGPADELEDTANAQPAIFTVSIAYLEAIRERSSEIGRSIAPVYVAGHSLGEFTALVAAGVMDFRDALTLVRARGRFMKESGELRPGGMAAVIGLEREELEQICDEAGEVGIVVLANDNCPGQSVISGENAALTTAMELAEERGAKKVVKLGITIASHSPLMERAAQQLNELVARIPLREPQVPIVANITGQFLTSVDDIRQEISHHVLMPVQWSSSVRSMVNGGVTTFLEVGPGQVLSGLIRRIRRDVETLTVKDYGVYS
jgi:[acyl-carrier-protein] S-malonyltransferase